jgi:hypothetical protein
VSDKDLFGNLTTDQHGRARWSDPPTSHIAAKMIDGASLRRQVLVALRANPPSTQWEVTWALSQTKQSISPRFRELERKGLVERCGTAWRLNDRSRHTLQELWRAKEAADG